MTDNLSDFMQCAVATKVRDEGEFNYKIESGDCDCEPMGVLWVSATSDMEALEHAWLHIISERERLIERN